MMTLLCCIKVKQFVRPPKPICVMIIKYMPNEFARYSFLHPDHYVREVIRAAAIIDIAPPYPGHYLTEKYLLKFGKCDVKRYIDNEKVPREKAEYYAGWAGRRDFQKYSITEQYSIGLIVGGHADIFRELLGSVRVSRKNLLIWNKIYNWNLYAKNFYLVNTMSAFAIDVVIGGSLDHEYVRSMASVGFTDYRNFTLKQIYYADYYTSLISVKKGRDALFKLTNTNLENHDYMAAVKANNLELLDFYGVKAEESHLAQWGHVKIE